MKNIKDYSPSAYSVNLHINEEDIKKIEKIKKRYKIEIDLASALLEIKIKAASYDNRKTPRNSDKKVMIDDLNNNTANLIVSDPSTPGIAI